MQRNITLAIVALYVVFVWCMTAATIAVVLNTDAVCTVVLGG